MDVEAAALSPSQSAETKIAKIDEKMASRQPARKTRQLLPSWASSKLRNGRAWKTLFRSWLACWLCYVVILPNKSLATMGTAGFFALLTSMLVPPYLPVQMFLLVTSLLLMGVCLGWGFGVAAMRAANSVRNPVLLQAAVAQLRASPAFQANPTFAQLDAIFHGAFLDIRSSAVYGGFLIISTFIFGAIRAYAPTLLLTSVYGTIAIDVFCCIGPLFPTARYTLLNSVAISIAVYMGISVVVTILVFPESMNHLVMNSIGGQLRRLGDVFDTLNDVLDSKAVQDHSAILSNVAASLRTQRRILIDSQKELIALAGFLNLEFSWGKWSSKDVHTLQKPLLSIVTYTSGLESFVRLLAEPHTLFSTSGVSHNTEAQEREHAVLVSRILPSLGTSTLSLRRSITDGLSTVHTFLDIINKRRWHWHADLQPKHAEVLDKAIEDLSTALSAFITVGRLDLIDPYTKLSDDPKMLYASSVFSANLVVLAKGVLAFMVLVRETAERRQKTRLWAPTGLRSIGKVFRSKKAQSSSVDDTDVEENVDVGLSLGGEDIAPPVVEREDEHSWRRDPDSKAPANVAQKFFNGLHAIWSWTETAEAKFIIKYVVVSVALWVPSVIQRSAHLYYVQKGLWALIMAQMCMNLYVSDQIFNLVTRLLGTLIGLALGLVAWYMGNGAGKGNVYGSAASVGVLLLPLVFIRIFGPPKYLAGVILCVSTFALIVGYSWIDGHVVQYATPGIGWSVAWRRWVLVVIGAGASFVMMMLPPTSGRKAVRIRNAQSITSLSNLYGFIISTWIADASSPGSTKSEGWSLKFQARLTSAVQDVQNIRELTELAKWEGSLRGAWPSEDYFRLVDLQINMISSIAQIGVALARVDDEWRIKLLQNTKVLNPHFISDVMAMFSLVSHSLRTAEPLHQVLPSTLLDRLFYHHNASAVDATEIDDNLMKSENYMYYALGTVGVYQLLQSLDEMHMVTKRLCGEVPLNGFTAWKEDYERSMAAPVVAPTAV